MCCLLVLMNVFTVLSPDKLFSDLSLLLWLELQWQLKVVEIVGFFRLPGVKEFLDPFQDSVCFRGTKGQVSNTSTFFVLGFSSQWFNTTVPCLQCQLFISIFDQQPN